MNNANDTAFKEAQANARRAKKEAKAIEIGKCYRFDFVAYDDMPKGDYLAHCGQTVEAKAQSPAKYNWDRDMIEIVAIDGWTGFAFPEELIAAGA